MANKMRLVRVADGVEIKRGDTVTTFRGEVAVLEDAREPQHSGSTGRVYVRFDGATWPREFFPGVIGAEWVAAD